MTEETEHQHPTSATRQARPRVLGVVFGVHLSAGLSFGLIPITRDNPPLRVASRVGGNFIKPTATKQTDKLIEKLNEL